MQKITANFSLAEFENRKKYPDNIAPLSAIICLTYGCAILLQPLRYHLGSPVIITSGYRNTRVNKLVGGVPNSQHLTGCAADLKFKSAAEFSSAVTFLSSSTYIDQLLTGRSWLHVSWNPYGAPRHDIRIGYYSK